MFFSTLIKPNEKGNLCEMPSLSDITNGKPPITLMMITLAVVLGAAVIYLMRRVKAVEKHVQRINKESEHKVSPQDMKEAVKFYMETNPQYVVTSCMPYIQRMIQHNPPFMSPMPPQVPNHGYPMPPRPFPPPHNTFPPHAMRPPYNQAPFPPHMQHFNGRPNPNQPPFFQKMPHQQPMPPHPHQQPMPSHPHQPPMSPHPHQPPMPPHQNRFPPMQQPHNGYMQNTMPQSPQNVNPSMQKQQNLDIAKSSPTSPQDQPNPPAKSPQPSQVTPKPQSNSPELKNPKARRRVPTLRPASIKIKGENEIQMADSESSSDEKEDKDSDNNSIEKDELPNENPVVTPPTEPAKSPSPTVPIPNTYQNIRLNIPRPSQSPSSPHIYQIPPNGVIHNYPPPSFHMENKFIGSPYSNPYNPVLNNAVNFGMHKVASPFAVPGSTNNPPSRRIVIQPPVNPSINDSMNIENEKNRDLNYSEVDNENEDPENIPNVEDDLTNEENEINMRDDEDDGYQDYDDPEGYEDNEDYLQEEADERRPQIMIPYQVLKVPNSPAFKAAAPSLFSMVSPQGNLLKSTTRQTSPMGSVNNGKNNSDIPKKLSTGDPDLDRMVGGTIQALLGRLEKESSPKILVKTVSINRDHKKPDTEPRVQEIEEVPEIARITHPKNESTSTSAPTPEKEEITKNLKEEQDLVKNSEKETSPINGNPVGEIKTTDGNVTDEQK